ncbi:hypothetical protein SPI_02306 [Niveomyces insectorum RCEF 264]|uniref:Uncharacterized protein n=1 Tax=Niveomyces insectorum RCEF 264 TaxID=1081102 RepID=A0A167XX21_9HYPO|nr:hypothetical protein SPI_02306 [Niveomyces insectorum RCEF 264]
MWEALLPAIDGHAAELVAYEVMRIHWGQTFNKLVWEIRPMRNVIDFETRENAQFGAFLSGVAVMLLECEDEQETLATAFNANFFQIYEKWVAAHRPRALGLSVDDLIELLNNGNEDDEDNEDVEGGDKKDNENAEGGDEDVEGSDEDVEGSDKEDDEDAEGDNNNGASDDGAGEIKAGDNCYSM